MPLGEVTNALISAWQAAFKGLSDFAVSYHSRWQFKQKHNAWKALSIVLASAGHNTAAPSIIASYSKLCEQADALRHRPLKIPLHAGGAW